MNLTKQNRCFFRLNSSWAQCSAVCMGLSIFLRMVYYFGITDFSDLTTYMLVFHVILPVVLGAGYLVMLRGLRFNSPVLHGVLAIGYAVIYLMIVPRHSASVISAVLMTLTGVLLIICGMGLISTRLPLLGLSAAALLCRVIAVDWGLYLHAPSGFHFLAYLPELSNLFALAALLVMCPSIRLIPLQRHAFQDLVPDSPAPQPEHVPEHVSAVSAAEPVSASADSAADSAVLPAAPAPASEDSTI